MLKINCFLYAVRVQGCKQREAYLSMWESRKQPYLPLIKSTKTQYKEGGRRIRPARYTCRAINTTYSANPSVLEIIELAITIRGKTRRSHCLIVSTKKKHILGELTIYNNHLFIIFLSWLSVCMRTCEKLPFRNLQHHEPTTSPAGAEVAQSLCFRWIGAHLNRERTWPLPLCLPPLHSMFV